MTSIRSNLPQDTLDLLILKVVARGPVHGYAIAQRLGQASRGVVQVPEGSLYPALRRLENCGLLAADWKAIETGRLESEEQAVQEALALWEKRERRRLELLAMLDEAERSLARGEGREITEASMTALADEIKQRGRRRIAEAPVPPGD